MSVINVSSPLLLVLALVAIVCGVPARVRYDQRQEGDLNVRADLENFVILVIPTTAGASPSTLGLLDLLAKAMPMRGHNKRGHAQRKPTPTPSLLDLDDEMADADETQTFIESKTAPYHVDITKARRNLAKLHPQHEVEVEVEPEELLVSPNLALIKPADHSRQGRMLPLRISKGFVLSMPLEVEEGLVRIDNQRIEKSKEDATNPNLKEAKETRKKSDLVKTKEKPMDAKRKLLLLGAEHDEDCGPGYERDGNGVCKFLAHI